MDQTRQDDRVKLALKAMGQGHSCHVSDAIDGVPTANQAGDDGPVYCEARPVTPEEMGAWYGQRFAEYFETVAIALGDFVDKVKPFLDDLAAMLADDANVRAYERSRADVAKKRRALRRGKTPPPNALSIATRRGDTLRVPRDRGDRE